MYQIHTTSQPQRPHFILGEIVDSDSTAVGGFVQLLHFHSYGAWPLCLRPASALWRVPKTWVGILW